MRLFFTITTFIVLLIGAFVKRFLPTCFLFGGGMVLSVERIRRSIPFTPALTENTVVVEEIRSVKGF